MKEEGLVLPPKEIAYSYTVAMWWGQELERNLRAILYSAHYQGWIPEIEFDEGETKRFAKDAWKFIDEATCGLLLRKLNQSGFLPKTARNYLDKACALRNVLAHGFLVDHDYGQLTKESRAEILEELNEMGLSIYRAVLITRALHMRVKTEAESAHGKLEAAMAELGLPGVDRNNLHYKPKRKRTSPD